MVSHWLMKCMAKYQECLDNNFRKHQASSRHLTLHLGDLRIYHRGKLQANQRFMRNSSLLDRL